MQVLSQSFDYKKQKEFVFGFFSDLHLDAHDHDAKKMKKDFDHVKSLNGRMYINGDLLDLILPGDRKRYVKGNDITTAQSAINEIIDMAVQALMPYVNHIDGIGVGNHESSVVKYHSIDPTQMIIRELNHARDKNLPPILHMGYTGYIVHNYFHGENNAVRRLAIWYHHGTGGSSPVTKGIIGFNRVVYGNDADVYWLGHLHSAAIDAGIERLHLNKNNEPYVKTLKAFYTAGYKGGHIHKQVGKYGYTPDFSTEKFYNHSSSGMVIVKSHPLATPCTVETELTTSRN